MLLTNSSEHQTTSVMVVTDKGTFGPYPTKYVAEQMIVSGGIPFTDMSSVRITEQSSDGSSILFG